MVGGERGGPRKSPTVQVGPPNGSNTASLRTTPRHGTQPTEPPTREHPNQQTAEPNRPTRTATTTLPQRTIQSGHNPQDKPPTRPAHPIRKELQPTRHPPTNSLHHPTEGRPEPGNRGPPSGWGRELRRGLRGTDPHAPHHPPNTNRDPPAEHRHLPDSPTLKPNPIQKPDPKAGTPPPSYHPTTHAPPGTLHTCHGLHPTDANACQQTGTNSGNKSSQKQTTSAQASTQPPPHHLLPGRGRGGHAGGTTLHAPCAQRTSTTSSPATTTN